MRTLFSTPKTLFAGVAILCSVSAHVAFAAPPVGRCPINEQPCPTAADPNRCISEQDLCILEPIPGGGADVIPASDIADLGAFRRYVNNGVWQWAFGIGIAIAVLNGAIGGLEIVLSNGDSGKVEAGKTRFFWSAMGLVLLLLSGVILEFLNPLGFLNV